MLTHRSVRISDRSSIGEARRCAVQTAQSLGFDETARSNIGIVATECATNVLSHAGSGELLVCPFQDGNAAWLDLIAVDCGPGIRDVARAMEDGFSTAGTPGNGLGSIQRMAPESSLLSMPGKGTAHWSRFTLGTLPATAGVGVVCVPIAGETVCGDSFLVLQRADRTLYLLVDGLGHGAAASEAAVLAVDTVTKYADSPLEEILQCIHSALRSTRGAAMLVASVPTVRTSITYAGVGNISGTLVTGPTSKSFVSQNGTLGAAMPNQVQEYTLPLERNSLLVMWSDGLTTRATLSGYPGYANRPPALLAALLYRDFSRKRDDASVMVARVGSEPA